jgi:hypothetical protein
MEKQLLQYAETCESKPNPQRPVLLVSSYLSIAPSLPEQWPRFTDVICLWCDQQLRRLRSPNPIAAHRDCGTLQALEGRTEDGGFRFGSLDALRRWSECDPDPSGPSLREVAMMQCKVEWQAIKIIFAHNSPGR